MLEGAKNGKTSSESSKLNLGGKRISALQKCLLAWYDREGRDFPWRKTRDAYKVLVSEVLLQKTASDRVAGIYHRFFGKFPSVKKLARADEKKIREIVGTLGLKKRAAYLSSLAREISNKYAGKVPEDRESLISLTGVGEYTCDAVLCFAFGKRCPILDTNVRRVLRRHFGLRIFEARRSDKELRGLAASVLPHEKFREFNYALLDFAAKICLPSRPLCRECPLLSSCRFGKQASNQDFARAFDPVAPRGKRESHPGAHIRPLVATGPFVGAGQYGPKDGGKRHPRIQESGRRVV